MFDTWKAKISRILMFDRRARREIRRTMHKIIENLDKHEETMKKFKDAVKRGSVEEVMPLFHELLGEILEFGEIVLLKDEIHIEVMELRIEDDLKGAYLFLDDLKEHVQKAAGDLDKKEQKKLENIIDHCRTLLHHMYLEMLDDIIKEYQALEEQRSAKAEGREDIDHWFAVRAKGAAVLTRAMRNVFKLPGDRKTIEKDLKRTDEVEKSLVDALEHIHKQGADAIARMEKNESALEEDVKLLTQHVQKVFARFLQIVPVFVKYFFYLQAEDKSLEASIKELRDMEFPEAELKRLEAEKAKYEKKVSELSEQAEHVMARARIFLLPGKANT